MNLKDVKSAIRGRLVLCNYAIFKNFNPRISYEVLIHLECRLSRYTLYLCFNGAFELLLSASQFLFYFESSD